VPDFPNSDLGSQGSAKALLETMTMYFARRYGQIQLNVALLLLMLSVGLLSSVNNFKRHAVLATNWKQFRTRSRQRHIGTQGRLVDNSLGEPGIGYRVLPALLDPSVDSVDVYDTGPGRLRNLLAPSTRYQPGK
jgi:hypothetical protein